MSHLLSEYYEKLAKLKEEQAQAPQAQTQASSIGGYLNPVLSLRDRISDQLDQATRAYRKHEKLERLAYLLDKNPEVTEILDLLEKVQSL